MLIISLNSTQRELDRLDDVSKLRKKRRLLKFNRTLTKRELDRLDDISKLRKRKKNTSAA